MHRVSFGLTLQSDGYRLEFDKTEKKEIENTPFHGFDSKNNLFGKSEKEIPNLFDPNSDWFNKPGKDI